jgi:hypothetical protein
MSVSPYNAVVKEGESLEVNIRMASMEGVFFGLVDDAGAPVEILNWGARTPDGLTIPTASSEVLVAARERLVRTVPSARSVLWARVGKGAPNERAKVSVLTAKNGWMVVRPRIVALQHLLEPEMLVVTGGVACNEYVVDLTDSQGVMWEGEWITFQGFGRPPLSIRSGEPAWIPEGAYRIHVDNDLVGLALVSNEVNIDPALGAHVPIRLTRPLRRAVITVECPDLDPSMVSGMVGLTSNRGGFSASFQEGRLEMLVTDGPLACAVRLVGGRRTEKQWVVSERNSALLVQFE